MESKLIRVDTETHEGIKRIAVLFGVPIGKAISYLVADAIPRVDDPQSGDVLGMLVKLNERAADNKAGGSN